MPTDFNIDPLARAMSARRMLAPPTPRYHFGPNGEIIGIDPSGGLSQVRQPAKPNAAGIAPPYSPDPRYYMAGQTDVGEGIGTALDAIAQGLNQRKQQEEQKASQDEQESLYLALADRSIREKLNEYAPLEQTVEPNPGAMFVPQRKTWRVGESRLGAKGVAEQARAARVPNRASGKPVDQAKTIDQYYTELGSSAKETKKSRDAILNDARKATKNQYLEVDDLQGASLNDYREKNSLYNIQEYLQKKAGALRTAIKAGSLTGNEASAFWDDMQIQVQDYFQTDKFRDDLGKVDMLVAAKTFAAIVQNLKKTHPRIKPDDIVGIAQNKWRSVFGTAPPQVSGETGELLNPQDYE